MLVSLVVYTTVQQFGESNREAELIQPIFQSCHEVPVFINDATRSMDFRNNVRSALQEVGALSGRPFKIAGYTTEMPTTPFSPRFRDRDYLIIALIDRAQSNIFPSANAVAATTYFTIRWPETKRIGAIVIDKLAYESFEDKLFAVRSKQTILRHELGHVIGFSHSDDWNLMNANVLEFPASLLQNRWPKYSRNAPTCHER
jgi:hypothetical protein